VLTSMKECWKQDDLVGDDRYDLLLREAQQELERFVTKDGSVAFSTQAHIVTSSKPSAV